MAEMRRGSKGLLMATFILAAVLTSTQGDKPVATLVPPAEFATTTYTTTTHNPTSNTTLTTAASNTTTHTATPNTTPASQNTTTQSANITTTTSFANTTTAIANITTTAPTTQNTTAANVTVLPTTPQPAPTPSTNLTLGNYTVKNGNDLCIMVQAAIQISVNNSQAVGTFIVQPNAVNVSGDCQNQNANIKLNFNEGFIFLSFTKNDTTKTVYVNLVNVNLKYAFKSGVMSNIMTTNSSMQLFSTASGQSYSCKSESVFLGDGIFLNLSKERSQAFDFVKNQFGPLSMCPADQPDYSVAIAVGVVLIILILIVVIAYLVSRRKRTDGYQSL